MEQIIEQAAIAFAEKCRIANIKVGLDYPYDDLDMKNAFEAGAEFQAKQNPWRNFKDERPNPNSHILRRMTNVDYKPYGKVVYYADYWGEDRPDKWEQDSDRIVYEWQYINA